MWDVKTESEAPGTQCESAAIMLQAEELKIGYAQLCVKALQLFEDPAVRSRLNAEAEKGSEAGWAARRIVEACKGCDESGYSTQVGNICPNVTRERVQEWLTSVDFTRYASPPADK